MGVIVSLNAGQTCAFESIHDDAGRSLNLFGALYGCIDCIAELFDVVAVNGNGVEAESDEFICERLKSHNIFCIAVNHVVVSVNEHDAVGKFIMIHGHECFPV